MPRNVRVWARATHASEVQGYVLRDASRWAPTTLRRVRVEEVTGFVTHANVIRHDRDGTAKLLGMDPRFLEPRGEPSRQLRTRSSLSCDE